MLGLASNKLARANVKRPITKSVLPSSQIGKYKIFTIILHTGLGSFYIAF